MPSADPVAESAPWIVARRPLFLEPAKEGLESRATDSPATALGAVELVFETASARSVEGIEVVLGRDGEPSNNAVTGESDAAGRITFIDLPPGRYRWWPANDAAIELNPPHEATDPNSVAAADAMRPTANVKPAEGRRISGVIDVVAGEVVSFRVVVRRGTSIIGRIPVDPSGNVETGETNFNAIHLSLATEEQRPIGPLFDLTRNRNVRSRFAKDPMGEFEFKDVAPGSYLLNAWWRRGADYFIVRRTFDVLPAQRVDLGLLEPRKSAAVEIETRAIDVDKSVLSKDRVFGKGRRPVRVRALLDAVDPRTDDAKLTAMLDIDLLTKFRVFGLADGNYTFSIVGKPESSGVFPEVFDIEAPLAGRFSSPATTAMTYDYIVKGPRHEFTVEVLGDPLPSRLYCCAIPEGSGPIQLASKIGIVKRRGSVTFRMQLAEGRHRILLHSQMGVDLEKRYPAENVQAFAPIVVSSDSRSTSLTLSTGVCHVGRAVNTDGAPSASKLLVFRPKSIGGDRWTYSVMTDADGVFILKGIPPGETLVCKTSEDEIVPNDGKGAAVLLHLVMGP